MRTYVLRVARLCLVHLQVSNTHDWHGTQRLARTNEQETQQLQQKAKQRRQQQQQQAKTRQQQQNGGETRVSTLSPNPAGVRSADDVKARTPTVCAQTIL